MGYQALLFCPDEKTARTVTQVLSELDFSVVPCTEPFAAVKKLMNEHFDAVVVDCDNEQNVTLLFKSARNTVHNQSALAVAVVEGQAGVAKAFRIGANLVLTKPINVEQAKGTLRVARGLLRKSEGAKPAAAAVSSPVKPPAAAPAPPKLVLQPSIPRAATALPTAQRVTASVPTQKPAAQPSVVASVPIDSAESDDIFDISEELTSPLIAKPAAPATGEPKIASGFGSSAASAPAPARDPKPSVSIEEKSSRISETRSPVEAVAAGNSSAVEDIPAPEFTFGGNVNEEKSSSGGSKKALLVVAAVVVIAACSYVGWMQWGHSGNTTNIPARIATQPVTTPATAPHGTPSDAAQAASATPSPVQSTVPDSAPAPRPNGTAKTSSDTRTTASAENAPTEHAHPSKASSEANSSKPSAAAVAANKAPETKAEAQPIMIRNGISKPAAKPAATADAPAPSLTGIAPADNAALPNLVGSQSNAPTPVLQALAVSQGVSQGLLLKRVQPTYPANARQARIEGAVQLMATITRNGDISAVKVLSGEPQLAHAAVDAVKQWKYKPYLLNGSPVEIQTQVTVNFKLPH
jgi:protein TonB